MVDELLQFVDEEARAVAGLFDRETDPRVDVVDVAEDVFREGDHGVAGHDPVLCQVEEEADGGHGDAAIEAVVVLDDRFDDPLVVDLLVGQVHHEVLRGDRRRVDGESEILGDLHVFRVYLFLGFLRIKKSILGLNLPYRLRYFLETKRRLIII